MTVIVAGLLLIALDAWPSRTVEAPASIGWTRSRAGVARDCPATIAPSLHQSCTGSGAPWPTTLKETRVSLTAVVLSGWTVIPGGVAPPGETGLG